MPRRLPDDPRRRHPLESAERDVAVVTVITRQKRRRRADITFDDGSTLSLSLEVIVERRVREGASLDESQRRELEAEDAGRTAVATALRLLAAGPRSERDLRDRLRRRALPREAVDAAVARMRDLGYLNDAAFARLWVESRQASTPRSRRFLRFELGRKGVERGLADEAVEAVSDEDAAYEAARRRLRNLQGLEGAAFERRLGAFLTSRGFGYGVARAVIDRCRQEIAEAAASRSD